MTTALIDRLENRAECLLPTLRAEKTRLLNNLYSLYDS